MRSDQQSCNYHRGIMQVKETRAVPDNRTQTKQRRREQLIKATINCVAKRGFSATTMADITKEAGLSLGIVNLHFKSKEKLLLETLKYLSEEYRHHWEETLKKAGPAPADKLAALVDLDFSNTICERKKLAVWFAFWGETRSHPVYMKTCAEYDHLYAQVEEELFTELLGDDDKNPHDPQTLATIVDALVDGLWLDMLVSPKVINRKQARDLVMNFLHSVLPDYFHPATGRD